MSTTIQVTETDWRTKETWKMWGSQARYKINKVAENGQVTYSKIFKDGKVVEMCNPMHLANFKLENDTSVWRDKDFRTAEEAATQWQAGEYAIMTVLGDFYVKITMVSGEKVFGEVGSQEKVFMPYMGLNGAWRWKERGRSFYPLRHDDGRFHEYDD